MNTSRTHTPEIVHPYVRRDITYSQVKPLYDWLDALLDLSAKTLNNWASQISQLRWFDDPIITQSLRQYCAATEEKERYTPWCILINRVLELAPGHLDGISEKSPYPIDDICFVDHSEHEVARPEEHGMRGARCCPDIACMRAEAAKALSDSTNRTKWSDFLSWWEVKFFQNLLEKLENEKVARRNAQATTEDSAPATTSNKSSNAKIKMRNLTTTTRAATVRAAASIRPPAIGEKRKVEHIVEAVGDVTLRTSGIGRNVPDSQVGLIYGRQAALQSGSYALELLSCTYGTRVSCISVVLKDDRMFLWYYDASGVICTEEYLSIIEDFEKVAAIIVAMARCTPEQLGALPSPVVTPPSAYPDNFPPENLTGCVLHLAHPENQQKVLVTLGEPIFTQYTLTGRRTFLYEATTLPAISPRKLAIKFSYQISTRPKEQDLLEYARAAGVGHFPEALMWGDLWKLSKGGRRGFDKKRGSKSKKPQELDYEDRILRAIIYVRYEELKMLFPRRCDLIPVMVDQMIDCLYDLRHKANMLHRDISVNNIMWEEREGKYYFRLIDFDNATIITDSAAQESSYVASSRHRMGTLPFMAYELVMDAYLSTVSHDKWTPIQHLLRHDWASLFFVSTWCGLTMVKDRDDVNDKALCHAVKSMETGINLHVVADYKRTLCTPPVLEGPHSMVPLPSAARCLDRWFLGWRFILQDSFTACQNHNTAIGLGMQTEPFEIETAGGTITRGRLKSVLTPLMPFRQEEPDGWDEVFTSQSHKPTVTSAVPRTQKKHTTKVAQVTPASRSSSYSPAPDKDWHPVSTQDTPVKKATANLRTQKNAIEPVRKIVIAADDIRSRLRVRRPVIYKE